MRAAPGKTLRGNGGRAALATIASAAMLIPTQAAQGASKLGKKLGKKSFLGRMSEKAVRAQVQRNRRKLRRRFDAHPGLATNVQPKPVAAAQRTRRDRHGRATASQAPGVAQCRHGAAATFRFTPGEPPNSPNVISANWTNTAICGGAPVAIYLATQMIDPRGRSHVDNEFGVDDAAIIDSATGPEGVWTQKNKATYLAQPGSVWKKAGPECAGLHTPVLTCIYPKVWSVSDPR